MRTKIASVAFILGAAAATSATAEEISVDTTIGFESRYVFRGVEYAETSFQPAITLNYSNFYVGAWTNLPIGDDDNLASSELDLFAGYGTDIAKGVSLDVGVTFYTYPDNASGFLDLYKEDKPGQPGTNTVEPYVGLSFDAPLSPSLYLYRDFMLDTFTLQGAVSHSFPMTEKTSFDVGGTLGYVFDDDTGGDYLYGTATAGLSYAFTDKASFSLGARYGGSDIAGGSIIKDSIAGTYKSSGFWWGLGFSSSF